MPDSWLDTLLDESVRMGAAVAVILSGLIIGGLFLLNLWKPMFVSARVSRDQLVAEQRRSDEARQWATEQIAAARAEAAADVAAAREDAAGQIAAARVEMNHRMANFRVDHQTHVEQMESAYNLMLTEAKRYADGWLAAYHIEAENNKTSEARMTEVVEGTRLLVGLVTALQQQTHHNGTVVHQLPPRS